MKNRIIVWFAEGLLKAISEKKPNIRSRIAWAVAQRKWNKMQETTEKKPWYKSKTLQFNALTALAGVLTFLMSPDAKLDPQVVGTIGSILAIVNMALRFITNKSLTK